MNQILRAKMIKKYNEISTNWKVIMQGYATKASFCESLIIKDAFVEIYVCNQSHNF